MTRLLLTSFLLLNCLFVFGQKRIENKLTDQHQVIIGTKVSLIAPKEFTAGVNFFGLQHNETGSSIMVVDFPGPFSEVARAFTKDQLQTKGIEVEEIEKLTINGLPATFVTGKQSAHGIAYSKYTLAFGSEDETMIINGGCPHFIKELGEEIKQSMLSVYYDASKVVDPMEALDYTIDVSQTRLKFAASISMALIFTLDSKVPTLAKDKTSLIVSKSHSPIVGQENEAFCTNRLAQSPLVVSEIKSTNEITINGLSGYAIVANGKSKETGDEQQIYQVILFNNGLYYILIGTTNDLSEVSIAEIKKAVATFKLK